MITFFFYIAAFLQGCALVLFPSSGALLTDPSWHHLSPLQYGTLFLYMLLGVVIAVFSMPRLIRHRSYHFLLLLGLALNCAGLLFFALTQRVLHYEEQLLFLLHLALFCSGAGFCVLRALIQPYLGGYFPWQIQSKLHVLILTFGAGCAVFPLLFGLLASAGVWWIAPLSLALLFLLFAGIVYGFVPEKLPPEITLETDEKEKQAPKPPAPLKMYLASAFLYGICETFIGNHAVPYLHQMGWGFMSAAWGLALFWGMVAVGRALLPVAERHYAQEKLYAVLPWALAALFALLSLFNSPLLSVFVFAAMGVVCSAYLPLNSDLARRYFAKIPEQGGLLAIGYFVGCGAGSYIAGLLRQDFAFTFSSLFGAGFLLALLLSLLVGRLCTNQH